MCKVKFTQKEQKLSYNFILIVTYSNLNLLRIHLYVVKIKIA